MVKINDKVRANGIVTTIEELDQSGKIKYEMCDNYHSSRTASGLTTKYFANLEDGSGWEISKSAYLSRTGQKDKIMKVEKLITSEGLEITKHAIDSYNRNNNLSANEHCNTRDKLGTWEERQALNVIARSYGLHRGDKLTSEDVRRYIDDQKRKIS